MSLIEHSLFRAARLEKRRVSLGARIGRVSTRVVRIQNARLFSGGAFAVACFIAAVKPGWGVAAPAAAVFAPVFIGLVILTRRWSGFLVKLRRWQEFNARQEARAFGRAPHSPNNFAHEKFGSDLDFFGDFSLWTLLDETLTDEGSLLLKSWITSHPLRAEELVARQNRVKSLRREAWFYTRLTLIADRAEMRHSSRQVLEFLTRAVSVSTLAYVGVLILWIGWMAAIVAGSGGSVIAGKASVFLFFAFALSNYVLIGGAGQAFKTGVGVSHHLSLLTPVLGAIEKRTALREIAPTILARGPAREARALDFAVGLLGTSANPILHLLLNAILPFTATGLLLLERARRKLDASFAQCLAELAELEALFSLVLFEKYQTPVYPRLDSAHLSARRVFHPLIPRDRVVANDFAFENGKHLGLLTGSNMSGKSTFLRTIGLNQALANIGAPVFADEMATRPLAIESCIEVSDSLRDGFSYFYAEVRRLKALLDSSAHGGRLYLIDEIFRGTNNRERQIGSRAVIEALARSSASEGFVSTHDLELTSLEMTEPAVLNLHFKEDVENGAMSFSYKLQNGASPTTNALRIMQLEGLPVDAPLTT